MRLAAAKVRLELHYWIAALSRQPLDAPDEHSLKTFGEERPAEELLRLAILIAALAQVHLPQVRRELRLLVSPSCHVSVRRNHFAPRLKRPGSSALDQCAASLSLFAAHLLVDRE